MRPLRPFALEVFFSKWEFTARYHLCASDMQSMTISDLLAMADAADRSAWDQLYLGYTETWGSPTLRETIAATYDTITSDQVLSFVGAEEGIFAAMHALLGPDDHAITVIPNYQSVESVPLSICDTTGIALDPKNNWNLDLDQVRDAIRPNTRVICINFPPQPHRQDHFPPGPGFAHRPGPATRNLHLQRRGLPPSQSAAPKSDFRK